jgi:hypothetical protein
MKSATWVTVLVVLGLVAAAQADESIVYTQAGPLRGVVADTFRSFKAPHLRSYLPPPQ